MDLTITTRPTDAEILAILSVATMKLQLRISHSIEDAIISRNIIQAYDWLAGEEGWLNRTVLTTTWKYFLPGFKKRYATSDVDSNPTYEWKATRSIEIPKPKLQTVTSVRYMVDGAYVTLATDQYVVTNGELFGYVTLLDGLSWPSEIDTHPRAIEIVYVAGYGAGADVLAQAPGIERAMIVLAGDYYRNREDTYAEPRLVAVNRKIINGLERAAGRHRIMNNYA